MKRCRKTLTNLSSQHGTECSAQFALHQAKVCSAI